MLLKISGHETELTARATNQIGYAYTNLKRYDDALVYFREALTYNLAMHGENFELSYEGYNNIANVLAGMGRTKEAIAAGEKAWTIERRNAGADNPDTLWFENNLASYYLKDGNAAKAADVWADVVQAWPAPVQPWRMGSRAFPVSPRRSASGFGERDSRAGGIRGIGAALHGSARRAESADAQRESSVGQAERDSNEVAVHHASLRSRVNTTCATFAHAHWSGEVRGIQTGTVA